MPDLHGAYSKLERRSRAYYLLSVRLREHPPTTEPFTLKQLSQEFDLPIASIYQTIREYRNDSLARLKYMITPEGLNEEGSFRWALTRLHEEGFYLVTPLAPLSGYWGEPTFRQMEDNNLKWMIEGLHRVKHRLSDAIDFRFEIDGLDINQEFEYVIRKEVALEDFNRTRLPATIPIQRNSTA